MYIAPSEFSVEHVCPLLVIIYNYNAVLNCYYFFFSI